jgi:hypothetical protein
VDDRRRVLAEGLLSNGPDPIKARLHALIGVLPSPLTDSGNADVKVKVYQLALSDLPAWAVIEACDLALRGKIGNYGGRYLPTPGELHEAAGKIIGHIIAEKRSIDRVLTARIEGPFLQEDRAEAIARVNEAARKVSMSARFMPANELARMRARKGDQWDTKLDAQEKSCAEKFSPVEQNRADAAGRLAEMTYLDKPTEASPALRAAIDRRGVA